MHDCWIKIDVQRIPPLYHEEERRCSPATAATTEEITESVYGTLKVPSGMTLI